MNLCDVNGKIPDLKRHHPIQSEYTTWSTLADFEQLPVFVLLSFCDESWGFGIKASYFFMAFSGKKVVTVSQQEYFGLEQIGRSPIIA